MKKYLIASVVLLAAVIGCPKEAHAQYTYFPPLSGQSAGLHDSLAAARTRSHADSLRHTRRSRKSRLPPRSHRSHRTRHASRSRR